MAKFSGWRKQVGVTLLLASAALFLPTTLMLSIGMLPTWVMLFVDRTRERLRALTVGAMNLAGCMPFIMELWERGQTVPMALSYLTQPRTIVVMYFAAAIGYMIEWAVTGLVASMAVQKAKARINSIEKRSADMEERWGAEVNGTMQLDDEGFPIDTMSAKDGLSE